MGARRLESDALLRMIDANMNRLREGLRVVEDLLRFSGSGVSSVRLIRLIRTELNRPALNRFAAAAIKSRDTRRDPGAGSSAAGWPERKTRTDRADLLAANFQRAKESARVLEEACKALKNRHWSLFKKVRFMIYDAEKKATV